MIPENLKHNPKLNPINMKKIMMTSHLEGTKILGLANKAYSLYKRQNAFEKAKLLKIVQSNSTWDGANICPTYGKPFDMLAKGLETANWGPSWDEIRNFFLGPEIEFDVSFQNINKLISNF